MKKNFILGLAAISMLSFASCETDPAAEKNLASDVVEGIPTTATITLTNAPSTMATEPGESNESQIDNATLYVCSTTPTYWNRSYRSSRPTFRQKK